MKNNTIRYSFYDKCSNIQYHLTEHAYWQAYDMWRFADIDDKLTVEEFIRLLARIGDFSTHPFIRRDINGYHEQLIGCERLYDTSDREVLGWKEDEKNPSHWISIGKPTIVNNKVILQ